MVNDTTPKLDQIDASSTARINRRDSVFARIEAALLADKLSVLTIKDEQRTGTDPYNSFRRPVSAVRQGR